MPVYAYKGFNAQGRKVAGVIDAESPKGARISLRRTGVFPTDLSEERAGQAAPAPSGRTFLERVSTQDLALMTRQLATLAGAGLPLVECLSTLIEQMEKEGLKRVLSHVRQRVREGQSLADALRAHPRIFSHIYVSMIQAGEASGTLEVVLARLADYSEEQAKLWRTVRVALTYPFLMVVVASLILLFLLAYVVPQVTRIFSETGQTLPLATLVLISFSSFLAQTWWALLLLGASGTLVIARLVRTPWGRLLYDRFTLQVPWLGRVLQKIAVARFSRTLSTLLASGVPILTALDIVKNIVSNTLMRRALEEARVSVQGGESLAAPLRHSALFPALLVRMIAVGERSGELETMLARAADAYDGEVEKSVTSLTTLLEPLTILIMGAVVLFIVLAILLPIFELNQLVR